MHKQFQLGSQQETEGTLKIIQGEFNYKVTIRKGVDRVRGTTKDGSAPQVY